MKFKYFLLSLLMFGLMLLSGCACEHAWTEADCLNAKSCTKCQETEGDPLGHSWEAATCQTPKTCARCGLTEGEVLAHTPGSWEETRDPITAQLTAVQHCTLCQAETGSRTEALETLSEGGIFVFTPREFVQRLEWIAGQNGDSLTWEFLDTDLGLQANVFYGEGRYLIQFFRNNASVLTQEEEERAVIWCLSLSVVGTSEPDMRSYFYMACDPSLTFGENTATLDAMLIAAVANANASGVPTGYQEFNQLLYEVIELDAETFGLEDNMHMTNVYASSFLD